MKVKSLWRYPVKSMAGEQLDETMLSRDGVIGDRCYAIHDGTTIRGAKKFPALMKLSANYQAPPDGISIPPVNIRVGEQLVNSEDPEINDILSRALEQNVTLDQLRSKDDLAYYESPADSPSIPELQKILGLEEGEPFPDFSDFPPEAFQYSTPPGSFFDAFPLLILTTSSLATLAAHCPDSQIDERRFRPNLVIDTSAAPSLANGDPGSETGFIEEAWHGGCLKVGDAIIRLTVACPRCSMITRGFEDLPDDTDIMRKLVTVNHHKLGIYGHVEKPGKIHIGDDVSLSDTPSN